MGCAASSPVLPPETAPANGGVPAALQAKAGQNLKQEGGAGAVGGPAKALPVDEEAAGGTIKAVQGQEAADSSGAAAAAKSRKTRARRLSYVAPNADGGPVEAGMGGPDLSTASSAESGGLVPAAESAPAPTPAATRAPAERTNSQKKANTRARRLSYVTDANNMAKLEATQISEDPEAADEEPATEAARTLPTAQVARSAALANISGQVTCQLSCMSRAGREPGYKKQNQDNCFAFEKYVAAGQALFGAFDGHGPNGHLVSGFVKQHLPIVLVNQLAAENDTESALVKGFLEVNESLTATRIDCEFSGSTAVVSLLRGTTLTTAWVGDSRCVLGRRVGAGSFEAIPLTRDHKPTVKDEKARILAENGRVERLVDEMGQPIGPFRVWLQRAWVPGLAMSRALGDALAHKVGVTSVPELCITELTPDDAFIILASDGVWEFIGNQEAVDIIGSSKSVEEGCRSLVDEAHHRWLVEEEGVVDDITAVCVHFSYANGAAIA
ncbi:hypothetical protein WJX73_003721 [Symbiochloris irregularis]|uniref:PPM-type phosphatase domain-containing protein n=1 Tax=Symbiochloris irregularis TaxID=706552 RepID=A0AAW1NYY4_9CHLO